MAKNTTPKPAPKSAENGKWTIKEGCVLRPFGPDSILNNEDLTIETVNWLREARPELFELLEKTNETPAE